MLSIASVMYMDHRILNKIIGKYGWQLGVTHECKDRRTDGQTRSRHNMPHFTTSCGLYNADDSDNNY